MENGCAMAGVGLNPDYKEEPELWATKEQYRLQIEETTFKEREALTDMLIEDPFITTSVRPRGWRAALAVLFGRYEIRLHVKGSRDSLRRVFWPYDQDKPAGKEGGEGK